MIFHPDNPRVPDDKPPYSGLTNNKILRRLQRGLGLGLPTLIEIFKLAGHTIGKDALIDMLRNEETPGYKECPDNLLSLFLDGLIIHKRGPRPGTSPSSPPSLETLDNNMILKKLRIALSYKDEDLIRVLKRAGFEISAPELNALFRKKGHRNYRECGDQLLRNFLKGLETERQSPAAGSPGTPGIP